MERILTTHVGSLPRPASLLALMRAKNDDESYDASSLATELRGAVESAVARQVEVGLDIVSDGEMSKPSYATYVTERLTGFEGSFKGHAAQDLRDYLEFAKHLIEIDAVVPHAGGACCRGPVTVRDTEALQTDLDNFGSAVECATPAGAFMNAASPGVVAVFQKNEYYATDDEYIDAIAEALRPEYETIVAAGFLLQIDSPDLAMGRHLAFAELDDAAFLRIVERNVVALNQAVRNIPADRMRMHLCWGNYPGPHHRDIPLRKIVAAVLRAKPKYLLLEGANPRHEHEWQVFSEVRLPDDKVLVPGVIDSTSNYIEHPEVVAQRICRYADVVGRERVMAGSDCGFSTFSGYPTVYPEIAWAKLGSLAEGARLASKLLWQVRRAPAAGPGSRAG
ncbi:MAG: cobalamin-independent methionine synthase II family protein [Gammaproteobacteria bacterium]|nr:cobalamin-independent methionine synthase II family protein [Gammaproteobacteria bacterium]NND36765.1 cobalamin-independent methionine synthase II family protein [Gammaproteobacteria bacterium]